MDTEAMFPCSLRVFVFVLFKNGYFFTCVLVYVFVTCVKMPSEARSGPGSSAAGV